MKNISTPFFLMILISATFLTACTEKNTASETADSEKNKLKNGGFSNQVEYGEHLVTTNGCNDCHTPKKLGSPTMELDSSLMLSGYSSRLPIPDVNRSEMESKGVICTNDLTAWVGPWGVSYTANLTPDPTGTGNWDEATFIRAIRLGKYKGIESGRDLLPPMPWQFIRYMTDDELKAIFAYLRTVKPVKNLVPAPQPPALARK